MDFSQVKAITIPEGAVTKIVSGDIILWQASTYLYKNWAKYSTENDGVTIYNSGVGYKDGYRVRSGGAEQQYAGGCCTGFIPFKVGDTLRIYPSFSGENALNAINFSDGSFNNLGQVTDSGVYYGICNSSYKTSVVDGVSTLTLTDSHDSSIQYVRITHKLTTGADLIITINEELN